MIARGIKDLRIIKLILYLFEGMLGLAINFHKTCIFSKNFGQMPTKSLAQTFNCARDLLPLTYLEVPISI